uniref:Carbohydrate kinase PfkB domain-containing protein n=1 Tax=Anopheles atroparvus TaxID=41427 RepID=A0AAG5CR11_ANOAO
MFRIPTLMARFCRRYSSTNNNGPISASLIDIMPEVHDALRQAPQLVVALESTIITHGMPYPHNLDTALEVEHIVRQQGAVPATIAIVGGRIKVGVGADQLRLLARADSGATVKTSRRDMAYVLAAGLNGGTTVAGTLLIAQSVAIRIFATGGIGGVHREGERTMDISADLIELGRCPVAVVSSGVKSILDIPRTLEYLETQGVCVATYGSDDCAFPAFYTRSSGSRAPYNLSDATAAAKVLHINRELGLRSGILIGVPIPELYALDSGEMDQVIAEALREANQKQIHGKEVTPFILSAVSQLTRGKSLDANMALIKNNARVAAEIAVELNRIENGSSVRNRDVDATKLAKTAAGAPLIIGGSVIDVCITVLEDDLKLDGATYHAKQGTSPGGVARNIAEGIYKIYGNVNLISAVGNDQNGAYIRQLLPDHCASSIVTLGTCPTASFSVLLDRSGDCRLVVGDMAAHQAITPEWIKSHKHLIQQAPLTVIDANISEAAMTTVFDECLHYDRPVFFEPTDMRIADRPYSGSPQLAALARQTVKFTSPNLYELRQLARALQYPGPIGTTTLEAYSTVHDLLADLKPLGAYVNRTIENVLVTLGQYGVAVFRRCPETVPFFDTDGQYLRQPAGTSCARFYAGRKQTQIVNVSGAGDSFTSGFIVAAIAGRTEGGCVAVAFEAAGCALRSRGAVAERYFDAAHPCWTDATGATYRTF